MRRKSGRQVATLLGVLLVIGCSAMVTPAGATTAAEVNLDHEETVKENGEVRPVPDAVLVSDMLTKTKEDLAGRLDITVGEIEVLRVEEVDWPDSSLGCPQYEMRYAQVLVNGVFVQLSVEGRFYNYHGGGGRGPFLCTSKSEVLPEDLPNEMRGNPDI